MQTRTSSGIAVGLEPADYLGRRAARATLTLPGKGEVTVTGEWGEIDGRAGLVGITTTDRARILITIPRADYDAVVVAPAWAPDEAAMADLRTIDRVRDKADRYKDMEPARCITLREQAADWEAAWDEAHPREAAWLLAEAWAGASSSRKAAAGKRARTRIEDGDAADQAIADMRAEWAAETRRHTWD